MKHCLGLSGGKAMNDWFDKNRTIIKRWKKIIGRSLIFVVSVKRADFKSCFADVKKKWLKGYSLTQWDDSWRNLTDPELYIQCESDEIYEIFTSMTYPWNQYRESLKLAIPNVQEIEDRYEDIDYPDPSKVPKQIDQDNGIQLKAMALKIMSERNNQSRSPDSDRQEMRSDNHSGFAQMNNTTLG